MPTSNTKPAAVPARGGWRDRLHILHGRMGDLWWYTSLMFSLNRGGDLINMFIGAYLVPKFIDPDELGAILPLMAVGAVFSAPIEVLLLPVGKFLNTFLAWGEPGKAKALLQDALMVVGLFAIVLIGVMFLTRDAILLRLHVEDKRLLWPIVGFAVATSVLPRLGAAQFGLNLFKSTLLPPLTQPLVRLTSMLLLLPALGVLGYLLAQLTVQVSLLIITGGAVFMAMRGMSERVGYRKHRHEMLRYTLPLVLLTMANRLQHPVELFVIRHRLPKFDSGGFYFAMMFGMIATYFSGALMPYLLPLVSDRFERGQSTRGLLLQPLLFNLAIGGALTVLFAIIMPHVFRIPGPWTDYAVFAGFVWQVSLIKTLKTSVEIFKTHENACRRFGYMWYVIPIMLIETLVLYGLPAWPLARPYLPASLWSWVARYSDPSLQRFVTIMIAAHAACALGSLIHIGVRVEQRGLPRQAS